MGYGSAPNASHFTGKRRGKTQNNRKKRIKVKKAHKNKYESLTQR